MCIYYISAYNFLNNNKPFIVKMADEAAAEEDEDEFSFEGFDYYLDGLDEDSLEEPDEEEKMPAVDPDASCGTEWLDGDDSCHRSIQIAFQRAKC